MMARGRTTRIAHSIEFGRDGRQTGFLQLPHSVHRSAYGHIPIPIVHLANGDGPRVLLMAGNHGDEYEGQLALLNLARTLRPDDIAGRLTILPAANFPAVRAGLRTSPIDGGNLNRSFPGDPDGGPTAIMAHFIESELMAGADWVIDVHSGGSSLMYVPAVLTRSVEDGEQLSRAKEALQAFGAPIGLVTVWSEDRTAMAAAGRQGAIAITTELGGGGTVTPATLGLAERGLRRVLHHAGLLRGDDGVPAPEPVPTRLMDVRAEHYVYASDAGLFEPLVDLGDRVEAGQPVARIHFYDTPWREPETVGADAGGLVVCKRVPCLTERGDCIFHLAEERGE
jgi:uncharacterized protein